ncbi:Germin-like protein [Drosera capensis]
MSARQHPAPINLADSSSMAFLARIRQNHSSDFKSMALTNAGETDNILGSFTGIVSASQYPGLTTLVLSIGRTDLEVGGLVSAHAHPRSSEMFFVVKGEIVAGFIDSHNKVFGKVVKGGDVFVVPRKLLHFIFNDWRESATMFSVFNSQNPGLVDISGALFQSDPSGAKLMTTKILASITKTAGKVNTREGHRVSLSQIREPDLQLDI